MRVSEFCYRKFTGVVIAGVIILFSLWGCEKESTPSGTAAKDNVKHTVLDPRGQPSGIFGRVGEAGAGMLANRNPDTQPKVSMDNLVPLRMAPRLDTLENKTIYLVDTGFAGALDFFKEIQNWFNENMPSVKTVTILKSGNAFVDSPELWPELKQKADGVVFGVGG
ncbi:MAG: hypothetical protein GX846_04375 [Deltaproteobacteria bacterium]|nr:hypothetical protein [Deltaproteobacteria bacterium]